MSQTCHTPLAPTRRARARADRICDECGDPVGRRPIRVDGLPSEVFCGHECADMYWARALDEAGARD